MMMRGTNCGVQLHRLNFWRKERSMWLRQFKWYLRRLVTQEWRDGYKVPQRKEFFRFSQ